MRKFKNVLSPLTPSYSDAPLLTRSDRLIKGWLIAGGANILGVASHGLAGGNLPHPILWLLCTALSALICVPLAGVRLPRIGMGISVVLSQALLHFLYMNSGGVAHVSVAHAHHGGSSVVLGTAPHHHADLTWQMVFLHLCAAAVTYAILRHTEVLSERTVRAVARKIQRLWWVIPTLPLLPQMRIKNWIESQNFSYIREVLREVRLVRGPPVNSALS